MLRDHTLTIVATTLSAFNDWMGMLQCLFLPLLLISYIYLCLPGCIRIINLIPLNCFVILVSLRLVFNNWYGEQFRILSLHNLE